METINEEMSNKDYLKKRDKIRKEFNRDFIKNAFIAYEDGNKLSSLALKAVKGSDSSIVRDTYKWYNKYKKTFEEALSDKNKESNRQDFLDKAIEARLNLVKLKKDVARSLMILKKSKSLNTKKSDKDFKERAKSGIKKISSTEDFKSRVRQKVAKINFASGK